MQLSSRFDDRYIDHWCMFRIKHQGHIKRYCKKFFLMHPQSVSRENGQTARPEKDLLFLLLLIFCLFVFSVLFLCLLCFSGGGGGGVCFVFALFFVLFALVLFLLSVLLFLFSCV